MEKFSDKSISAGENIIGLCSFISLLGVVFGLVSIVLGAVRVSVVRPKLIALGMAGILFTAAICAVVFYTVYKGEVFRNGPGFTRIAKQKLKNDIMAIEFYKEAHGYYPENLVDILDKAVPVYGMSKLYDSSLSFAVGQKPRTFFYQLTPDKKHYYLLGLGEDGVPFSADDLDPELTPDEMAHLGYVKK